MIPTPIAAWTSSTSFTTGLSSDATDEEKSAAMGGGQTKAEAVLAAYENGKSF